jgi:hypothetical protein
MQVTIIRDDNTVSVDGENHKVDCSRLPVDVHAVQWDGQHGEVEYRMVNCVHCGGRNKKPNMPISDLTPYKAYVDQWHVSKEVADAEKAAAFAARTAVEQARHAAG